MAKYTPTVDAQAWFWTRMPGQRARRQHVTVLDVRGTLTQVRYPMGDIRIVATNRLHPLSDLPKELQR